jgi:uncharacterized protein YyaL (SSP411 family)
MLYDNALLVTVISEAYQLTGRSHYRKAIIETLEFIERECTSPEGGFYAALDADSDGEEGKFYVWDRTEIESILGEDAELYCKFYGVRAQGNWEGKNILNIKKPLETFAEELRKDPLLFGQILDNCNSKLLMERSRRNRPQLDDKVLLGWNALMISGYCKAYAALGINRYKEKAIQAMEFILNRFKGDGVNYFYHSFKNGEAKVPAFLDDYAFLISALINLQEVTGDANYLLKANDITEFTLKHFSDEKQGFFYFTHQDQQDVILRKKEIYDGATPSGNAIMAMNLHYLSIVFEKPAWKSRSYANSIGIKDMVIQYPGSFGNWATLVQAQAYGMNEVVILGKNAGKLHMHFLNYFIPFRVYQFASKENEEFPLLRKKTIPEEALIFLCRDYSCQNPVTEMNELIPLLETVEKD